MYKKIPIIIIILLCGTMIQAQDNVGIGTTTPHSSAILELSSTSKGFLPPRLTTAQRDAITPVAPGLMIYNTTTERFEYRRGSEWKSFLGLTSVGLTLPSELTVSNSPLTSDGTISASWANQTANYIFAGPSTGSPAVPTFRALVANDIPNLNASKITAGILPVTNGGTGAATLTGILKGNGTNAVSGITNTAGNITYWTDANTIGGSSNLAWDNTNSILAVTGVVRHVPIGSAPGSPTKGMTYYNSTNDKLFLYDGTQWVDLGAAGSGSLPVGTTNQTLRYGTTDWEATNTLRVTSNQVAIGSGTFTPTSVIHSDAGDSTAHYHKFTAGTTTGQTANDGFDVGVNASSHAIINQKEDLPLILSTNNIERMRLNGGLGGATITVNNATHTQINALNVHNSLGAGQSIALGITNAITGQTTSDGFRFIIDAQGNAEISQNEDKPLIIKTNDTERMRFYANGDIGMGTSTTVAPDSINVQINGDFRITGDLIVDGNIDPLALILVPQSSPPNTTIEGTIYYDNNSNTIKAYNGSAWSEVGTNPTSNLELLNSDNIAKQIKFFEPSSSGTNFTAFKAQAQGNDITYTLPASVGSAGQVLTASDANGNLAWASASGIPSGTITMYAGTTAPSGWVLCDGATYSTSGQNANLFAIIGYTYGGSGGNFNVPDLRGRFGLGADNMGGNSANRVNATEADNLGQASGSENHILTEAEMPRHNHIVRARNLDGSTDATNRIFGYANSMYATNNPTRTMNEETLSDTGEDEAHNNMPPFMTVNYIIKL